MRCCCRALLTPQAGADWILRVGSPGWVTCLQSAGELAGRHSPRLTDLLHLYAQMADLFWPLFVGNDDSVNLLRGEIRAQGTQHGALLGPELGFKKKVIRHFLTRSHNLAVLSGSGRGQGIAKLGQRFSNEPLDFSNLRRRELLPPSFDGVELFRRFCVERSVRLADRAQSGALNAVVNQFLIEERT